MTLEILKKYGIKAKKSLGQNFLVNEEIVTNISKIINITGQNIIEVGPGYGALTEKLIQKKPLSLSLVELDKDMINILESRISNGDFNIGDIDFNIFNIDILKFETQIKDYSVIANIPYYITSPILRHFLYQMKNKPKNMLILMQKDVGDKILGKNKNKSSVLSLFIEKKSSVKEVLFVGKENFVPAPKIESSVLLFQNHDLYNDIDDNKFLILIKAGFGSPRKKLIKNFINFGLKKDLIINIINELSLKNDIRGEDLNIATWCELIKRIDI